jgi:hypothetical protein
VFNLRIGTDPTNWTVLQDRDLNALAQELIQASGPVVLAVDYPLKGNLVLSAHSAGAVWLAPPGPHGSHPTGVTLHLPVIRVPSATAVTQDAPGCPLPAGTDLAQLQQDVIGAMTTGTFLTVPTSSVPPAVLVLSGATLAYAVVCPQAPTA